MNGALHVHFAYITDLHGRAPHCARRRYGECVQVGGFKLGAGERDRTADLPFTRRLLCLLSYTGGTC